ncbi:unnamed protein product [Toxocara canis]|uniref:Transposase n=1 Tax=Toxocara canis TaxID=6265 RepID=A0A183V2M4_TOXCA|nr:unnamed protein product [Toxocara canis]
MMPSVRYAGSGVATFPNAKNSVSLRSSQAIAKPISPDQVAVYPVYLMDRFIKSPGSFTSSWSTTRRPALWKLFRANCWNIPHRFTGKHRSHLCAIKRRLQHLRAARSKIEKDKRKRSFIHVCGCK